ncbi:MAG: flagellar basal body-associated FliL family protein [Rhizobiales bacterium]|nr:flagellar basal body-associated FliL family protein [Hyphomicrobiales bacterium]
MAAVDQEPPAKKGPSIVIQIAVLLVLTAAAAGGAWFAGGLMRKDGASPPPSAAAEPAAPAGHGEAAEGAVESGHGEAAAGHDGAKAAGGPSIVPLAPIMTNLAQPSDTWLRMELAVVFDKTPADPRLAENIQQDLLAYVRTLKLHQIEGPSAFQQLRADLDERAAIRSDGLATQVLIRTLMLE